VKYVTCTC